MQNLPKRIIQIFIIFILLLTSFTFWAKEVKAQDWGLVDPETALTERCYPNKITAGCASGFNFGNITAGMINYIYCYKEECKILREKLKIPNAQPKIPNSAIDFIAYAAGEIYANPPASFGWYAQDFLANAGLGPRPAYAQGIGFTALNALLPLWRASRNIAYTVLVIVMVAIGFMIIFRMKIDPKTVISVQAALPKIIITLLLITFSYAIVGFMIDVMYVVMAIVISLIASNALDPGCLGPYCNNSLKDNMSVLQTQYMTGGLGTLWGSVFSGGIKTFLPLWQSLGIPSAVNVGVVGLLSGAISASIGGPFTWLLAFAIPLILIAAIILGLLFTAIRLTLILFNSYLQLLVSVILGPILILQEAIPGRSAFGGWLMDVVANLSVFPTTAAVLLFGWVLTTGQVMYAPKSGGPRPVFPVQYWEPPLLGFGTSQPEGFMAFLGLAVFFLAPTLVVSVKKIFKPKPTIPVSAGTAISPLTGAISTGMGAASQFYYMGQVIHGAGSFAKDVVGRVRGASGKPAAEG